MPQWLRDHWEGVGAGTVAVGVWCVRFFGGTNRAINDARKSLEETHARLAADLTRLLDLRTLENVALLGRINKAETEISVIKKLYEDSIGALTRANAENEDLKRQLKDARELKQKLAEYEEKFEAQEKEITGLRARIVMLEGRNGS